MTDGVLVAMSGGVDSTVAAAMLVESGARVVGVTFKQWSATDLGEEPASGPCCDTAGIEAARRAADALGIPHVVLDASEAFVSEVVDDFARAHLRGETPNPCVRCNAVVRLPLLSEKARSLDLSHVATGHYARVQDKSLRLLRGVDSDKDQSYALWAVPRRFLGALVLPLGDMTKKQVRKKAKRIGVPNADRPESQDVCFVTDDHVRFVRDRTKRNPERFPRTTALVPGSFVSTDGEVLGEHDGTAGFTVGQRRVGRGFGRKMYVVSVDPDARTVMLGDEEHLLSTRLVLRNVNWLSVDEPEGEMCVSVAVRYRGPEGVAVVRPLTGNRAEVILDSPVRAACPGQSAVFYRDEICIGGGVIATAAR
jgi:tRNA-specific 2-thiouridylase